MEAELIDHRYFYERDGVGNYACGIARDAVAGRLREYNIKKFGDISFLASLGRFVDNASVVGFFIEQAVLQSIESNGLAVGEGSHGHMDAITFAGVPNFNTSKAEALYVPRAFNYPGIDGIILRLDLDGESKRRKASVFPLQVTVAKHHKDSEAIFFGLWKEWQKSLDVFDIDITFLWITTKENSTTNVDKRSRSLRSRDVVTNTEYKSVNVHLSKVNRDIWERYEKVQNRKGKSGSEERMLVSEEPSAQAEEGEPSTQAGEGEPNTQAEEGESNAQAEEGELNTQTEEEPQPQRPTIDYRKHTVRQLHEILMARRILFSKVKLKAQLIDLLEMDDARVTRSGTRAN
jgi:hypothetical protein